MFLTRSEYDRGVSTFSPEGRLFQVEYSLEAIKLGSTAIGIATKEGVATSPLLESDSIEKIVEIDRHIGCAMSGLTADARSMIEHARTAAVTHNLYYDEDINVESLTQSVCDLALRFGEGASGEERLMSRPFGVALLIAGHDADDGYQLFHAEPSGTFYRYNAKAIGSGSEGAQAELLNEWHSSLTLKEAELLVLKILKQVMEEKLDENNAQLSCITKQDGFKIYDNEKTAELIKELKEKEAAESPEEADVEMS